MHRNGNFSFRAAARLNESVLAAVREIDHPGLLADCMGCMGSPQKKMFADGRLPKPVSRILGWLAPRFAARRLLPAIH